MSKKKKPETFICWNENMTLFKYYEIKQLITNILAPVLIKLFVPEFLHTQANLKNVFIFFLKTYFETT